MTTENHLSELIGLGLGGSMKEMCLVLALGCVVSVSCFSIFVVGGRIGERDERERIYTKCLKEHEALPHKDAVALCKERVK